VKTVSVTARSKRMAELLELARKENLILRAADGTEFILAEIDDFDREIELTRKNKELMKLLDSRAKRPKAVSLKEAKGLLGI